jgi:hypothetical protein
MKWLFPEHLAGKAVSEAAKREVWRTASTEKGLEGLDLADTSNDVSSPAVVSLGQFICGGCVFFFLGPLDTHPFCCCDNEHLPLENHSIPTQVCLILA